MADVTLDSPYLRESVVDSPVGLLVTEAGPRKNVMTVSFFSEVAHHPTTLWVSVAASAYTHELVRESGQFSLIVLHSGQKDLAWKCGTVSGRERDKCAGLDLYRGPEGFLCLSGAQVSVACRVRRAHDVGDHTLFIADILAGEMDSRHGIRRHLLASDLR